MRTNTKIFLVLIIVSGIGCSEESDQESARERDVDSILAAIRDSQGGTIYSLHPVALKKDAKRVAETKYFETKRGEVYRILGAKHVDAGTLDKIARALEPSLNTKEDIGAKCFDPRHAIRLDTKEIVICFFCDWMQVDGKEIVIDSDGEYKINRIWTNKGLAVHTGPAIP